MVRMGTLPLRLLSLQYGADIVYTEELVDKKMNRTKRVVNDILGTVDFVDEFDGNVVFRTCPSEKDRLVFQVGTSDAEAALKVGKLVEKDVSGFDVNMGCPKEFSIKGGMGAALLKKPEKIKEILCLLVENLSIPVTCKIRLLSTVEETVKLCKMIESCGVAAIGVHGRTKDDRPRHPNNNEAIRTISKEISIPIIANGGSKDIETYDDIVKFKDATNASSVMIARAAQWNCSVFRKEGKLPLDEVITNYLKYAVDYDNTFTNTKYCLQMMLRELQETPRGRRVLESRYTDEICREWPGMEDYFKRKEEELSQLSAKLKMNLPRLGQVEPLTKRLKTEETFFDRVRDDPSVIKVDARLGKATDCKDLPKSVLVGRIQKYNLEKPVYQTEQVDKLFYTTIDIGGKKYANSCLERNKRTSEQAAALAYLVSNPEPVDPDP